MNDVEFKLVHRLTKRYRLKIDSKNNRPILGEAYFCFSKRVLQVVPAILRHPSATALLQIAASLRYSSFKPITLRAETLSSFDHIGLPYLHNLMLCCRSVKLDLPFKYN